MVINNIRMRPTEVKTLSPKIAVIGVGGAGGNAVNNMILSNLEGCEFLVCNTDAQALNGSLSENKVQLGMNLTGGLGAGSRPEIGQSAAEESLIDVMKYLEGANMAFVTAGMGGGTGTGAAPVIAKACREMGILTVGVVTKPFHFEGTHRMQQAERGIEALQPYVDTLIVIPNQNLFRIANEKTTFAEAFKMADSVLQSGVRGVTDLMVRQGLVNLDFADIRTAMQQMGKAMMGTGEASGERRAIQAAEAAINNPLLDDVSMKGAHGVIINVTGGYDMTLFEADEACNRIRDEVDPSANIIFGATFDENMEGRIRVSIVATGIDKETAKNKISGSGSGTGGSRPEVKSTAERAAPVAVAAVAVQAQPPAAARPQPQVAALQAMTGREAVKSLKAPVSLTDLARAAPASPVKPTAPAVESAATAPVSESSIDMFEQSEFVVSPDGQSADSAKNTALRGTRYKNSFIPPLPIEVDVAVPPTGIGPHITSFHGAHTQTPVLQETGTGSTFRNVDSSVSASGLRLTPPRPNIAPQQRRAPSLFERITGSVQQRIDHLRDEGVSAPTPATRTISAGGSAVAQQMSEPAQGSLNISAPAAKPASKIDDQLDIPAFLRRQAN